MKTALSFLCLSSAADAAGNLMKQKEIVISFMTSEGPDAAI